MLPVKYEVTITFNDGEVFNYFATEIHFHSGIGGIDIHDVVHEIPVFPGKEEDVKLIQIRVVKQ